MYSWLIKLLPSFKLSYIWANLTFDSLKVIYGTYIMWPKLTKIVTSYSLKTARCQKTQRCQNFGLGWNGVVSICCRLKHIFELVGNDLNCIFIKTKFLDAFSVCIIFKTYTRCLSPVLIMLILLNEYDIYDDWKCKLIIKLKQIFWCLTIERVRD